MKLTGVMRMVTYITIIYIMHCTRKIQGRREAQPPGCTQNTLISLPRRPPIPTAWERGFVESRLRVWCLGLRRRVWGLGYILTLGYLDIAPRMSGAQDMCMGA